MRDSSARTVRLDRPVPALVAGLTGLAGSLTIVAGLALVWRYTIGGTTVDLPVLVVLLVALAVVQVGRAWRMARGRRRLAALASVLGALVMTVGLGPTATCVQFGGAAPSCTASLSPTPLLLVGIGLTTVALAAALGGPAVARLG